MNSAKRLDHEEDEEDPERPEAPPVGLEDAPAPPVERARSADEPSVGSGDCSVGRRLRSGCDRIGDCALSNARQTSRRLEIDAGIDQRIDDIADEVISRPSSAKI